MLENNDKNDIIREMLMLLEKKECRNIMTHYEKYGKQYYLDNKKKLLKQSRDWSIKNSEWVRLRKRQYRLHHPFIKLSESANKSLQRMKIKSYNKIFPIDLWKIAKKQRLICSITGDKLTRENISVDHIIPISKGGLNVVSNLRLTTIQANWIKDAYTDEELIDFCKKVVLHIKRNN